MDVSGAAFLGGAVATGFSFAQPAPAALAASVAAALGCVLVPGNGSSSSSSSSDLPVGYRVLVASVDRAAEWAVATATACEGRLDRYGQLVLDLSLVGKDIVGSHAAARKQRDTIGAASAQLRRRKRRRLSFRLETAASEAALRPLGAHEPAPRRQLRAHAGRKAASAAAAGAAGTAWALPAAAALAALVHCVEGRGFRLAHRETLLSDSAAAAPAAHTAALTFVREN
jgi:hypothetical protein